MRKFSIFMLLPLLAACAGTDYELNYSTSQHRDPNYSRPPQNPTSSFSDAIARNNENHTGMVSNTDDQIANYITYRLNEFRNYNSNIHKNISNLEIARAAAFLTDAGLTAADIEKYFNGNTNLMHMAVYVVDNRLNRCFTGGTDNPATCFIKWRDGNKTAFNTIANDIKLHTTKLNIADAEFNATDGNNIKFIVDNDGRITGATVGETKYNAWTKLNVQSNDMFSMDRLTMLAYGKRVGLSYSDFGTYDISRTGYDVNGDPTEFRETIARTASFAGGYASQRIAPDKITRDLHFTGRAVGNVRDDTTWMPLDGDSRLDFDYKNATSTLTTTFKDWYDVVVSNNGTITFDDYTGGNILKFGENSSYTKDGATMNIGFYGENPATGVPTEAAGTVQFHDTDTNIKMDIAFGVK